ncbi:hypothetical protein [Myxosarcina sp. GI1]|uniref:hypothetical protein n=1 Tax=Myxosarcina sp. GI1 TaxID=1541065 RepID=UPI00055F7658|nr:hypothetical protein [Myxosarcina sp. GI1]
MTDKEDKALEIAIQTFAEIKTRFPHLQIIDNRDAPVELSVIIPVQQGLKHEVNLNFQNRDELHFSVSHLWLRWFPCTNPTYVNEYLDAVSGFLSGKYQIIEHYRGSKCFKAEFQSPCGKDWKTIATSNPFQLTFPWEKRRLEKVSNT